MLDLGPPPARVAVVGAGNELEGDDGAGLEVVRRLQATSLAARDDVLLLQGGLAPENVTGRLRRFHPDLVLLVDAADMEQPPGTAALLDWSTTEGLSASTHTLPPNVLASYLVQALHCTVRIVGIQPAQVEFDRPLSPGARQGVRTVVAALTAWLGARPMR